MPRLFELQATPTDVVLRAAAIAWVVRYHAFPADDLGGGTAFLVLLSGANFARFAVKDGTPSGIRRSLVGLARQIFFPSLILIIISFVASQQFDWLELLFIRPHTPRISDFPVWFSQMMIHLLVAFYLLFSIPAVANATLRRPAQAMLLLFGVGVLLNSIAGFHLFDTLLWMPWNFFLGGVVYFLAMDAETSSPGSKWLAAACVLVGPMVAFSPTNSRFWWVIASGLVLVSVRYIPLPRLMVRVTAVVGAASFGIFLTHIIWIKLVRRFAEMWLGPQARPHSMILFAFGLLLGTLTWAAVVAFGRAYRAVQSHPARPALAE
jgi:hypothetical protein